MPVAILLAAVTAGGSRAMADQTDTRLDGLFTELKNAGSVADARDIESQIWAIWLRSDDERVRGMMATGIGQLSANDLAGALATFDRMVALAPNFAEGWNKRATTLYLMGRFPDSVRDIDRVLALEPRHFGALSGLGLCNERMNRIKEALAAFQRAREVDPNLPGVEQNIDELRKQLARESI